MKERLGDFRVNVEQADGRGAQWQYIYAGSLNGRPTHRCLDGLPGVRFRCLESGHRTVCLEGAPAVDLGKVEKHDLVILEEFDHAGRPFMAIAFVETPLERGEALPKGYRLPIGTLDCECACQPGGPRICASGQRSRRLVGARRQLDASYAVAVD